MVRDLEQISVWAKLVRSLALEASLCRFKSCRTDHMLEKQCIKCSQSKQLEEFAWANKALGKRNNHCRVCQKQYDNVAKAKTGYMSRKRQSELERLRRNQEFMLQWLSEHPCVDCGESDPIVLELDHQFDKKMMVCDLVRMRFSLENIRQELAKCSTRCANCHRRKTAKDFGWYKFRAQA